MAACSLKVDIENPRQPRVGGEPVSGTVIVTTTGLVNCKSLDVTTCWNTHGRGNIDQGDVDHQVVFQGQWEANREYRYPFTLKSAVWPPTYYGTLLNVSHWVRARANVAWAKDPSATAEFTVVSSTPPEDLKPPKPIKTKSGSIIGWVLGAIFITVILAMLGAVLLFLLIPLGIGAAGYWFFRVFLPRQVTGSIQCSLEPKKATAGETIRGELRFTPKRTMRINSIDWTVTCREKCSSGSGSDRKTHHHEILKHSQKLSEARELRFGEPQSFDFAFQFPTEAPPSLKFSSNELNWLGELRIDISRWPDWVQKFPIIVTSGQQLANSDVLAGSIEESTSQPPEETWFHEVLRQVESCQTDPANLQTVLDAVRDQVFSIRVDIDETLTEPPPSALLEAGEWRIAVPQQSDLELALVWPAPQVAPPPQTYNWRGRATILGFDKSIDALVMRVVPQ